MIVGKLRERTPKSRFSCKTNMKILTRKLIRNQELLIAVVSIACFFSSLVASAAQDDRPNVLWITIEDWGPDLSCYDTKGLHTPNVDQLAAEGIRYQWAFTTSPVCSTSRSAMMTGFHQSFIGANQHREHNKQALPQGIRPIPHLSKEAGYFTALLSRKTDCNFVPNTKEELFEGTDWDQRKPGQPFFARISFGGTHRSWNRDPQRPIDPADVELPPYYVDTPFVRRDWANGLEQMQLVDREVGAILKRLSDEGLADNTIVFFIGDHGRCHIRGKQFLYDSGVRIPMIMRWPGKVDSGQVNRGLVTSLDICATVLEAAGVTPPVPLHGKSLLDSTLTDRKYVFAARDKMDETHDAMRAIRSMNYKLIVNLMPERPYCQFNRYKEGAYPILAEMNVMNLEGKLTPEQAAFFATTKPEIELYDLKKDPHEVRNVANSPAYASVKAELLTALDDWRQNVIHDQGVTEMFRAKDVFPETCPVSSVDVWVDQNPLKLDFNKVGWPGWYPTRSIEEWRSIRKLWEPYVMRAADAKVPRPTMVIPNKQPTVLKDDCSSPSLASREIAAGEWSFQNSIASSTHDRPDQRSEKKHGPKLFYQANITNGTFSMELKPTGADAYVITLGDVGLVHVFRVRVNVEGGRDEAQEPYLATYAAKDEGQRKAKQITLLSEGIPDLKANQWNRIRITCLNGKAVVAINDETFTVYHDRIHQVKPIVKAELQHGSVELRNVSVTSM